MGAIMFVREDPAATTAREKRFAEDAANRKAEKERQAARASEPVDDMPGLDVGMEEIGGQVYDAPGIQNMVYVDLGKRTNTRRRARLELVRAVRTGVCSLNDALNYYR